MVMNKNKNNEIFAKKGHGNDITSCEWHPFQSLIASASKDHSIKLWCPRSKEELATMYFYF